MALRYLPVCRRAAISVQNVASETLLYDEVRHQAFCLNAITAAVWRLANGERTPAEIAGQASGELKHPVTEEIVVYALSELKRDGLLEDAREMLPAGPTRRELVKKLGYSAAILMPVVTGVFAPRAAEAYGTGGGCLLPNTLVTLADGGLIAAGLVGADDWLHGVDPSSGKFHAARVRSTHRFRAEHLLTFFTETGECVQSSPTHPFIRGWNDVDGTLAEDFAVGDDLLVADADGVAMKSSKVSAIQVSRVPQEVVIFSLDTAEKCFVSGGIVSHNLLIPIKQAAPARGDEFQEPAEERPGSLGSEASEPSRFGVDSDVQ